MHRRTGIVVLLLVTLTAPGELIGTESMTPLERIANTPKGQLKTPYPDYASVADEGHRKYMAAGWNHKGLGTLLRRYA